MKQLNSIPLCFILCYTISKFNSIEPMLSETILRVSSQLISELLSFFTQFVCNFSFRN